MKHTAHGYWLEEAGEVAPLPELVGDVSADVLVIGGGYTGMWAAWQVKQLEPEASVVLLESEICGHGPSGRNGGFCNVMWFSLPNMRQRWGDAGALAVARASREAIDGIEAFCREQEVDAWFRRGGYLQVSTAPAHDGIWDEAVAACRELGEGDAVQPLAAAEVAERCASPAFRGGAFYPDAATVQPARLALGLRERLLAAGVEHPRALARAPSHRRSQLCRGYDPLKASGSGAWRRDCARTDRGSVRAGSAVVAIGGAAKAPGAPLRNALTVTSSHIVLTEPVPDLLEEIGWTGGECITDSRTLIDYFRTTPDGRIAFGWGGGRIEMGARLHGRAELDPRGRRDGRRPACASTSRVWPAAASPTPGAARSTPRPPTSRWSSPSPGGNAFAAAGYTGNGVGPSHMVGRTLASLALDRRRRALAPPLRRPHPPQRVPPEPFHWLGGETIRRALISKENAELSGRSAAPHQLPDLPAPQARRLPHRPIEGGGGSPSNRRILETAI